MKKPVALAFLLGFILFVTSCTSETPLDTTPPGDSLEPGVLTSSVPYEAYTVTSEYLKDPEKVIPLAMQTASFWLKAMDTEYGGFYTYVSENGTIDQTRSYKTVFGQSRNAYAMAKAYQLTGKREYLEAARNTLDFIYSHGWDNANGGWMQELTREGDISAKALESMDWNSMKWSFNQLNVLDGITAMVEATHSSRDELWLEKSYTTLTERMWDARKGYEGYYDMTGVNWSNPQGKNIGTVYSLIPSHQMTLALLNANQKFEERLLLTADRLLKMVGTMSSRTFGIQEYYDLDWKAIDGPDTTYSGNLLMPAWSLAIAHSIDPRPEYKEASLRLADQILNSNAYDYRFGGTYATLDAQKGNPVNWEKSWWILGKCVVTGLSLYDLDKNGAYLKMADESMNFFMNHLYDSQYGDAFENADASGTKILSKQKGSYWKNAYDAMQLFYFTYLYGNLVLNDKPISLYYFIEAQDQERSLSLKPVTLTQGVLSIKSVTLDGKPYESFDGNTCTVDLPAHTGGELLVTFEKENQ